MLEFIDSFDRFGRGVFMGIMVGIGIDLVVILLLKDKDLIMNGKFKSKIMWIIVIKVYRKYIYLFWMLVLF